MGPDQTTKAVEPHHRPRERKHRIAFEHSPCSEFALEQFREVGEGQASQRPFTALIHPGHHCRPTGQQGCYSSQGVSYQHDLVSGDVQVTLSLRIKHRFKISQPLLQHLSAVKRLPPLEQLLNGSGITAGMLKQRHRPARLHQRASEPVEVIGIPAKAGHD